MSSIFDADYLEKQFAASMEEQAATQNALRLQLYTQACADWITNNIPNRDLGLELTALPTKPKKQVVSDAGIVTEVTWTSLETPVLPEQGALSSTSLKANANLPTDRIDQIITALGVLNTKLDQIIAKEGA